jgi:hypothetical protein
LHKGIRRASLGDDLYSVKMSTTNVFMKVDDTLKRKCLGRKIIVQLIADWPLPGSHGYQAGLLKARPHRFNTSNTGRFSGSTENLPVNGYSWKVSLNARPHRFHNFCFNTFNKVMELVWTEAIKLKCDDCSTEL